MPATIATDALGRGSLFQRAGCHSADSPADICSSGRAARPGFLDLEILYVDDGSSDGTPDILSRLADTEDRVVVVTLTRNFGHQAAVTAGLQHASGDAVVIIDADLQDPPEIIPAMIEKWREGYEIVYGIRTKRQEGWAKRVSYTVFYRFLQGLGPHQGGVAQILTTFRAAPRGLSQLLN